MDITVQLVVEVFEVSVLSSTSWEVEVVTELRSSVTQPAVLLPAVTQPSSPSAAMWSSFFSPCYHLREDFFLSLDQKVVPIYTFVCFLSYAYYLFWQLSNKTDIFIYLLNTCVYITYYIEYVHPNKCGFYNPPYDDHNPAYNPIQPCL